MKVFTLYFNGNNTVKFMVDITENEWEEFIVTVSCLKRDLYVATVTEFSENPQATTRFLNTTDVEHALPNTEIIFEDKLSIIITPECVEVTVL